MKYDKIAIKVNSIAEKLFALEFLSRKAKAKINKIVKSDTLGNIGMGWDHVFIDGDEISAFSSLHFDAKNYKIIPFDKIFEIDSFLKPEFVEVPLNKEYTAKVYKDKVVVGCQSFPISVIDELVKAKLFVNQ